MALTGILLAAGEGRRFGRDKRLLRLPGGDNLVTRSATRFRAVLDDVVVVLRPGDEPLARQVIAHGCRVTVSSGPGMGDSIRSAVEASRDRDGWLIMPADLPAVRMHSIERVARCLADAAAVVPRCAGRRGHPVGFSALFRDRLLALSGASGGRHILDAEPARVHWLDLDDPGIHRDIDTPADLADAGLRAGF